MQMFKETEKELFEQVERELLSNNSGNYCTISGLFEKYNNHLKQHDVIWLTGQELTGLLFACSCYPNWFSKESVTNFVRKHHPGAGDFQGMRHIADKGWDIVSSNKRFSRGRRENAGPNQDYRLGSLEHPNPIWLTKSKIKRKGVLNADSWNELLLIYKEIGCAVCGRSHHHYDKGHLDPSKPPEIGNIVPMCVDCNQWAQAHEYTFVLNDLVARPYKP